VHDLDEPAEPTAGSFVAEIGDAAWLLNTVRRQPEQRLAE
jgi:hypothetical protein